MERQRFLKAIAAGIFLTVTHLGCMAFGYWYCLTEKRELKWLLQDAVRQGRITQEAADSIDD